MSRPAEPPPHAGAGRAQAPGTPHGAPGARPADIGVWSALWTIYIVWGSTYLGMRVLVETIPPLLGAGTRFVLAGGIMLAVLAARRRGASVRLTRPELLSCLLLGLLLPGANAIITAAETQVPSGLAALLVASVPLWVIVLRGAIGERPSRASVAAVLVGFAGVALLVRPGGASGGASLLALLAVVGAAGMWATGSVASSRLRLPRDPLVTTGWQMLLGGVIWTGVGLAAGEAGDVHPAAFSARSVVAFAYLVLIGSIVAYTVYGWLLRNVPVSNVATYAYVNPVVAIVLGWLVLGETIGPVTAAGAAIIVVSVALVVRTESRAAQRAQPASLGSRRRRLRPHAGEPAG